MPDNRSRSKRYHSEYKSHYKKFGSKRPHTVKGEITRSVIPYELESSVSTPRAGLQSTQLGIIHEPPLQRRTIVPYEKNHNIFPTGTVKEIAEREWLQVDESAREKPHSSAPRLNKHSSKSKSKVQEMQQSPILLAEKKLLKSSPGKVMGYNYIPDGVKRRSTYTQDYVTNGRKYRGRINEKSPVRKPRPVIGGTKSGISPECLPAAGVRTATSIGDKRLLKPSDNSQYMKSPNRDDIKIYDSEYTSRFKYINGAWVESPELQGRPSPVNPSKGKMEWYKEAISRRNEAYGYAHHARGTHFSRDELDHQNRLNAQYCKDNESVSDHSASQSSKKHDGVKKRKEKKKQEEREYERPPVKKEAWKERPSSPNESDRSFSTSYTETTARENCQFILDRGRSPTPELRETGQSRRHHYDMTTNILNEKLEKSLTFSPERQEHRSRKQNVYNRSDSPATSTRSQDGSYIPIKRKEQDDDVMSEISMASRATTASETLEKSKDRRDHFWAKENKKLQFEN